MNFQDNVSAIFQARCNCCHNADKAKGGLTLETYGSTMQGGGSGKVVEPGDLGRLAPLRRSSRTPRSRRCPPTRPRSPRPSWPSSRPWIEAGAPETSGSVVAMKAKPKFEFKLDPSAMGKPVGPPAMPEGIPTEPVVVSPKANAIVAMAASPWAPLVAVAGHKQVLLYQSGKNRLVGVLPFPEGTIHVLKFSRNGALLLAGGGRGGQSGLAVVFDVKTGKRVFEIGKEYDVVLAADISPDHGQVALGGPSKVVRVYGTADGQLQFEMKKHTEWITAVEFSPDGVLLATGDRNNGLVVWEAQTGREFFDLRGHTAAITDVTWRLDSNVVASSAEDGSVRLWEMENGTPIKSWGRPRRRASPRPGSPRTAGSSPPAATGVVRVWDQNGGKQKEFEPFGDLALRAVFAEDDAKVVAGDWSGEVRVFDAKEGKRLANLAANPDPIAARLERARAARPQPRRPPPTRPPRDLAPLQAAARRQGRPRRQGPSRPSTEAQQDAQKQAEAVAATEKLDAEKAAGSGRLGRGPEGSPRLAAEKAQAEKSPPRRPSPRPSPPRRPPSRPWPARRSAVEKALNDKVAQDQALASAVEALKSATTRAAADQAARRARPGRRPIGRADPGDRHGRQAPGRGPRRLERAAAARAAAPGLLASATDQARVADEAVKPAQAALDQANAARAEQAKALADARAAAQAAKVARRRPEGRARRRDRRPGRRREGPGRPPTRRRRPGRQGQRLRGEVEALAPSRRPPRPPGPPRTRQGRLTIAGPNRRSLRA